MVTQKERLQNTGAVLGLATGKIVNTLSLGLLAKKSKETKIQANVKNTYLKSGLETLANKPAQTALAGAIFASPLAAGALLKSGTTSAAGAYARQNIATKAAVAIAAPAGVSLYVSSAKVREKVSLGNVVPASANIGKNVGIFIDNPSLDTAKNIFTENPIGTGLIAGGAALVAGRSISGAVANAVTGSKIDKATDSIKNLGIVTPQLSDTQTKFIPESSLTKTASGATPSTASSSTPGAVNILQNNYYSEKFIKKLRYSN